MTAGTLFVLDASLPGGFVDGSGNFTLRADHGFYHADVVSGFNLLNARSAEQTAFVHSFRNAWLWTAIPGPLSW